MLPEILLFGNAGSGKDSVAAELVTHHGAVALAMADPMKRLGMAAFGFTEHQLWGPSAERNKLDQRFIITRLEQRTGFPTCYSMSEAWENAQRFVEGVQGRDWVAHVLDQGIYSDQSVRARGQLIEWFQNLQAVAVAAGGLNPRIMLQTVGTEWGRNVDPTIWIRYAQRDQRKLLMGGSTYNRIHGLVSAPGQLYEWSVVTDGRFRNECLSFKVNGAIIVKIVDPQQQELTAGLKGHASEAEQNTIPDHWFDFIYNNDKSLGLEFLHRGVSFAMSVIKTHGHVTLRPENFLAKTPVQVERV